MLVAVHFGIAVEKVINIMPLLFHIMPILYPRNRECNTLRYLPSFKVMPWSCVAWRRLFDNDVSYVCKLWSSQISMCDQFSIPLALKLQGGGGRGWSVKSYMKHCYNFDEALCCTLFLLDVILGKYFKSIKLPKPMLVCKSNKNIKLSSSQNQNCHL